MDLDAYTRLRLQHGWSASYAPRLAVLRWSLLVLLTGEHPAIPGTRKPFAWHCGNFRYNAPPPLRAFLRQQAQASLARHGITEPVAVLAPWCRCSTRSRQPPDSPSSTGPARCWHSPAASREFIEEALQILQCAREQMVEPGTGSGACY